jgi:hypothetical protein
MILISIFFITIAAIGTNEPTNIEVNNPFKISIDVIVKCEWNNKIKNFNFIKNYSIKSGKITYISTPKAYKNCQIWPTKINLF